VKGWAALHAGGNATTAQFIAYVDTVTGKKLDPMLNAWLYKPGKPPYPKPMS
jgi:aminopeptidase N